MRPLTNAERADLGLMADYQRMALLAETGRLDWTDGHYTYAVYYTAPESNLGIARVTSEKTGKTVRKCFTRGLTPMLSVALGSAVLALMPQPTPAEQALEDYCKEYDC